MEADGLAYVWRIVYSMWPWWRSESRHAEWIELHNLALESLRLDRSGTELAEMHLLTTLGLALRDTGSPQALRTFHRVLNLARQAEDPHAEAQALHELGATHLQMGHASQAVMFLTRARRARTRLGYERGVALTDILLGQEVLARAHVRPALGRFEAARAVLLAVPDAHDAARALAWKGLALIQARNIPAAEAALDTARLEFLAVQAPRWVAQTLEWLGQAAEAGDRPDDARAFYDQAIDGYLLVDAAGADRVRGHLARMS
ncbi:tol-pal system YbgF family protein [Streptomyces sp. NPDC127061]|uniref:tetratricopeptide repeat protein n=1 Tax=Streptomyces sp. NPDC127061 TaxID=3347122 RepID=UPI00365923AC